MEGMRAFKYGARALSLYALAHRDEVCGLPGLDVPATQQRLTFACQTESSRTGKRGRERPLPLPRMIGRT